MTATKKYLDNASLINWEEIVLFNLSNISVRQNRTIMGYEALIHSRLPNDPPSSSLSVCKTAGCTPSTYTCYENQLNDEENSVWKI